MYSPPRFGLMNVISYVVAFPGLEGFANNARQLFPESKRLARLRVIQEYESRGTEQRIRESVSQANVIVPRGLPGESIVCLSSGRSK